jgi:hypothetical protein
MSNSSSDLFVIDPVMTITYMIEAHPDIGQFMESEDGCMVNLFWSNEDGWVPFFGADVFSKDEYFSFNLPDGGVWVEVNRVFNFVASDDSFVVNEVCKLKRNPVVYPDSFDDEDNFRVI